MSDRPAVGHAVDEVVLTHVTDGQTHVDDGGNAQLRLVRLRGVRYLYKRYRPAYLADVDERALDRLIAWRRALPPATRGELDRRACWPRYTVRRDGRLCGVLIPVAPDRFFRTAAAGELQPRGLHDLLPRRGAPGAPMPGRTAVLGHLIATVRWLHRQGVLVNDLQPDNVLIADGVSYLVDCDSMVSPRHWGQVAPSAAPDLMTEVVGADAGASVATDLHKLAWIAVRVVLDDPGLTKLGAELRSALAGRVDEGGVLLSLLDRPDDQDRWEHVENAWRAPAAGAGAGAPRARPVSRPASWRVPWLPPGFTYRPDPAPPVLPSPRGRRAGGAERGLRLSGRTVLAMAAGLSALVVIAVQLLVEVR